MTSEFGKFKEMMLAEEEKKRVLEEEIEEASKEQIQLTDQYEKAIINDDDEQADALQQQMSTNQRALKRKQDKLELMNKSSMNEEIENQADKVLQDVYQGIRDLNTRASVLAEEYHDIRDELIKKAREIGKLKDLELRCVSIANYVARTLPGWAAKQGGFHYNSPVDRYEYQGYVSVPNLKAFDFDQLQRARGGMML